MKSIEPASESATLRRTKAEEMLIKKKSNSRSKISEHDTLKLIHELEVHQIELELQNEELTLAHADAVNVGEKYSHLYDFAPIGYFTLSKESTILELNFIGSQMLGYNRSYTKNKRFDVFVLKSDELNFHSFLNNIITSKIQQSCDVTLTSNNGKLINVHLTGILEENSSQCLITAVDFTERKQAEDALASERKRLSIILEGTNAGTWEWNIRTGETVFNERWAEILGYTLDELLPVSIETWTKLTHSDDLKIANELLQKHFKGETDFYYCDTRMKHKNGDWVWIMDKGRVNGWDDDGKPLLMSGTHQEITAHKNAEMNLRESKERYRHAVMDLNEAQSISHIGSWKWHLKEGDVVWSDEMYRIFGIDKYTYTGRLGDVITKVIHPDDLHIVLPSNASAISTKEPFEYRIIMPDKTIRHIYAKAGETQFDEEGNPVLFTGIAQDITERKNSEEALRNAQRLESIGTLAGGIAHDFNNLMNAVMGQTSLALGKLPKESPAVNHLQKAVKASERVSNLTKQLLAYSGRGKFFIDEIDLNTLVRENVGMFEMSVTKNARLQYELGSPSPRIMGDISQLQQVIMNLIINAGESMDSKPGLITIDTGIKNIQEGNDEYIKYTTAHLMAGSYAVLRVTDTGCGISDETLSRIFDPFFTTKFTGRGLGLAAVLGIIRGHKGGLRIKSVLGRGTQFEIILPLVTTVEFSKTVPRRQSTVVKGGGKTILVIDDEASVIELLEDVLTDGGYKVLGALDPQKGLELYRRDAQNISLVILDFSMPMMNGKVTFEKLLAINSQVKVILCSGYSEEETMSVFGEQRPVMYFQKPYKPDFLIEKVSELIA